MCPRIRFTGRKIQYKHEFRAEFGDYVEAIDPSATSNQGDDRTEPCIALYPSSNVVRSWVLWSLRGKRSVRRTVLTKLHTPRHIIDKMNTFAGMACITRLDVINEKDDRNG